MPAVADKNKAETLKRPTPLLMSETGSRTHCAKPHQNNNSPFLLLSVPPSRGHQTCLQPQPLAMPPRWPPPVPAPLRVPPARPPVTPAKPQPRQPRRPPVVAGVPMVVLQEATLPAAMSRARKANPRLEYPRRWVPRLNASRRSWLRSHLTRRPTVVPGRRGTTSTSGCPPSWDRPDLSTRAASSSWTSTSRRSTPSSRPKSRSALASTTAISTARALSAWTYSRTTGRRR